MNVQELYTKYETTPNLQQHMLWVASLAKLITTNLLPEVKVNSQALIEACLFHDIAKVLSFKNFREGEEELQKRFIYKFGADEHEAANKIVAEIPLSTKAQSLIQQNNTKPFLEKIRNIMNSDNYEMKILKYADSRIAPNGLVTLKGRWEELLSRRPAKIEDEDANSIMETIQGQLQAVVTVNLLEITQATLDAESSKLAQQHIH